MNLLKEISCEHTRTQALKIAEYVGDDPSRFKALFEVFFRGPFQITQRASWPITIIIERNPSLIQPHLKNLLDLVEKGNVHNGVKRHSMRTLQHTYIPKKYHERVINLCFKFLLDKKEPVGIKVFCMTVLDRILVHNELRRELQIILEDQIPYASAGFKARAFTILKSLHNK